MAGVYGNMMVVPRNARGGALPTYQSNGQVYTPGSRQNARLDDSAGTIALQGVRQRGEDLRMLRWGIDRMADFMARVPEYEDRRAQSLAKQAFADYQNQLVEQKSQLSTLRGGDAIGANGGPDIVKQTREWNTRVQSEIAAKLGDSFGSDKARQYFSQLATEAGTNFTAWAFSRREQELDRYEKNVFDAALSAETNAVASDPDDIQGAVRSLGRVQALLEQQAAREGWAPEVTQERIRSAFDGMITAGVNTKLASGDVGGAAQLMSIWNSRLGAQSRAKLQKSLDDTVYRQYNAAIANGDYQQAVNLQNMALGGSAASARQAFANLGAEGAVAKVNTGAMAAETKQAIVSEAQSQGVPPELALAVAMTESDGRHGIADSRAGAQGLFQLMPGTAKDMGVDARNEGQNIRGGVSYLKKMLDKYQGNAELALMAYNWGPGNVDKWLKNGAKGPVPTETRNYPQTVANFMQGYDRKGKGKGSSGGIVADPTVRQTLQGGSAKLQALSDIEATRGMSLEDRTEELLKRADQMPAGAQKSAYTALVNSELAVQKNLQTAQDGKAVAEFLSFGRQNKWTAADWEKALAQLEANGQVSRDAVKRIRNEMDSARTRSKTIRKEASEAILADYYQQVDAQYAKTGEVVRDTSTLDRLLMEDKITLEQRNAAVDYQKRGGALQNLTQTSMNKFYKELTGGKKDVCPPELVEQAWEEFGKSAAQDKGRVYSNDEIKRWMAQQMAEVVVPGRLFGTSEIPRYQAQASEREILRPVLPDNMKLTVRNYMLAHGATREQADDRDLQARTYAKMLKEGGI